MSVAENEWWKNLNGDDIYINAYGVPPYDANAVADFIEDNCDLVDGTIIDLGCGPGRLGHILASRNPEAIFYGIDVSPMMIDLSRIKCPHNWLSILSDGESLPEYISPSVVYSVTVLQHLPEYVVKNYIDQIYNQLLPDGVFIFTYAVGDENTFLSHQVSDDTVKNWLHAFREITYLDTPKTHPNWYWVKAVR